MKGYEALQTELCGGCRHFRRHYVKWGDSDYRPIDYGHCVYPRLKKRRTDETCPHWKAADAPLKCVCRAASTVARVCNACQTQLVGVDVSIDPLPPVLVTFSEKFVENS